MIKIYVDGFMVETATQLPPTEDMLEELPNVRKALEGKTIANVIAIPPGEPKLLLITTRL